MLGSNKQQQQQKQSIASSFRLLLEVVVVIVVVVIPSLLLRWNHYYYDDDNSTTRTYYYYNSIQSSIPPPPPTTTITTIQRIITTLLLSTKLTTCHFLDYGSVLFVSAADITRTRRRTTTTRSTRRRQNSRTTSTLTTTKQSTTTTLTRTRILQSNQQQGGNTNNINNVVGMSKQQQQQGKQRNGNGNNGNNSNNNAKQFEKELKKQQMEKQMQLKQLQMQLMMKSMQMQQSKQQQEKLIKVLTQNLTFPNKKSRGGSKPYTTGTLTTTTTNNNNLNKNNKVISSSSSSTSLSSTITTTTKMIIPTDNNTTTSSSSNNYINNEIGTGTTWYEQGGIINRISLPSANAATTTTASNSMLQQRLYSLRSNNNNNNSNTTTTTTIEDSVGPIPPSVPIIPRIVGGKPVYDSIKVYPSFAFNGCGGTLIRPDLVLTAAHCVPVFQEKKYIYLGHINNTDVNATTGSEKIPIERIIPHPQWSWDTQQNDICILKLACKSYQPIQKLNNNPYYPSVYDNVTVIGYGSTYVGGPYNTELNQVTVQIQDGAKCYYQYGNDWIIDDIMICASAPNRDACGGDSGGPLYDQDKLQIGIVSFGFECASPNYPGVYTRISSYHHWIQRIIQYYSNPKLPYCYPTNPTIEQ